MAFFLSPLMLEPKPGAFVSSSLLYYLNLLPEKRSSMLGLPSHFQKKIKVYEC